MYPNTPFSIREGQKGKCPSPSPVSMASREHVKGAFSHSFIIQYIYLSLLAPLLLGPLITKGMRIPTTEVSRKTFNFSTYIDLQSQSFIFQDARSRVLSHI